MFHPSVSDGFDGGPSDKSYLAPKLVDKTGNQINTIFPYKTTDVVKGKEYYGWAFDDTEVGLKREAFIAGIDDIITSIVGDRESFKAYISKDSIPDHTGHLVRLTPKQVVKMGYEKKDQGWYCLEGTEMVGWLCPATLKYFKNYPKNIYFKIE